jgi:LAO/AO transport system kinase
MTDRELVQAVRAGERRAVARALTRVEADPGGALAAALYPHTGRAHVVGITGAPGSGKSTLVAALVDAWRRAGQTVGVVAVDPSSPISGGAVLGDRVRMAGLHGDPGTFIRSMATRGQAGGLAQAAADAVRVLDAAGYGVVLLETAGAGQAEVAVADECHTALVVVTPEAGDDIQAIKAGILEIADVFVVNKADLPGAEAAMAHLRGALALGPAARQGEWSPPVLGTVAASGAGVPELLAAISDHAAMLRAGGGWALRERRRAEAELRRQLYERLVLPVLAQAQVPGSAQAIVDDLVARRCDPGVAVAKLLTMANGVPPADAPLTAPAPRRAAATLPADTGRRI